MMRKTKNLLVLVMLLLTLGLIVACNNGNSNENETANDVDWSFFNERATTFTISAVDGDYETAAAMFSEEMNEAVGAAGLQAVWSDIIGLAGEFVEIYDIQNAVVDDLFISGVIMRHENTGFGWNVVFNRSGDIAGLNTGGTMRISEPATMNEHPVITHDGFIEEPIIIGAGTYFPLAGRLTIPSTDDGPVPAAVIVAGSGPHGMDGYIFGNTPYRDIAHFLANNGVAAIRHDKRTYAHGAAMVAMWGHSGTLWEENIEDALLSAELLRADPRIDSERIFIIGHSLGAVVAPRIYANGDFAGLVLMAATSRCKFGEVFFEQMNTQIAESAAAGLIDEEAVAINLALLAETSDTLTAVAQMTPEEAKAIHIPLLGIWGIYHLDAVTHTFADYIADINAPMLVMQGGRDFQVLPDVDFILMQELLAGRNNVSFQLYDNLNHLFVETTATTFNEHAMSFQNNPGRVYEPALRDMADWILEFR